MILLLAGEKWKKRAGNRAKRGANCQARLRELAVES